MEITSFPQDRHFRAALPDCAFLSQSLISSGNNAHSAVTNSIDYPKRDHGQPDGSKIPVSESVAR
jgi:hypothetical protein